MNSEHLFEGMRGGDLVLHFVSITVSQQSGAGIVLQGHGSLKINQTGCLYIEMVCTSTIGIIDPNFRRYPVDPFDPRQELRLEATHLDGEVFNAKGFSLALNAFFNPRNFMIRFALNEINHDYRDRFATPDTDYLGFEVTEECAPPANKQNSIISTLGSESYSWNQTEIKDANFNVSIVDHKTYVKVEIWGKFDINNMFEAVVFYLGLTSGHLPQPYAVARRTANISTINLKSVSNSYRLHQMPSPLPNVASAHGWPAVHYSILLEMFAAKTKRSSHFESAYSQWTRVWHAYHSEYNVKILALSISVEGLLNDIFIPKLKKRPLDTEFEAEKIAIIEKVAKLDISEAHRAALAGTVEKWGNIHPKKALQLLVQLGLGLTDEMKAWEKLRNSAAHPRNSAPSQTRSPQELQRLGQCLTLFYRLILNTFDYNGPQHEFAKPGQPTFIDRRFVRVLDDPDATD